MKIRLPHRDPQPVLTLGELVPIHYQAMPFITAVLAVSRILRRLLGEDELDEKRRKERAASSQRYIKIYNEEFVRFFPTVLSILVGRKSSIPRLTTAYDHLEKVCLPAGLGRIRQ